MTATLTVTREGAIGFELRRAPLQIELDGAAVGSLAERRDSFEAPLEPGPHTLKITSGRYSSRVESFEAADGGAVSFRCHQAMVWPRYVASLIIPSLGISLRREHP